MNKTIEFKFDIGDEVYYYDSEDRSIRRSEIEDLYFIKGRWFAANNKIRYKLYTGRIITECDLFSTPQKAFEAACRWHKEIILKNTCNGIVKCLK